MTALLGGARLGAILLCVPLRDKVASAKRTGLDVPIFCDHLPKKPHHQLPRHLLAGVRSGIALETRYQLSAHRRQRVPTGLTDQLSIRFGENFVVDLHLADLLHLG